MDHESEHSLARPLLWSLSQDCWCRPNTESRLRLSGGKTYLQMHMIVDSTLFLVLGLKTEVPCRQSQSPETACSFLPHGGCPRGHLLFQSQKGEYFKKTDTTVLCNVITWSWTVHVIPYIPSTLLYFVAQKSDTTHAQWEGITHGYEHHKDTLKNLPTTAEYEIYFLGDSLDMV